MGEDNLATLVYRCTDLRSEALLTGSAARMKVRSMYLLFVNARLTLED